MRVILLQTRLGLVRNPFISIPMRFYYTDPDAKYLNRKGFKEPKPQCHKSVLSDIDQELKRLKDNSNN